MLGCKGLRLFIHMWSICSFVYNVWQDHFKKQVILAHDVHVHSCFNVNIFNDIAYHCRSSVCFFSRLKKLVALKKLWYWLLMIFWLLIWEGNIFLHSFTFWLSLSSEVINEGSSCFHMKISSLFFCFCLAWSWCFFLNGWWKGKTGKCCFSWKLSWSHKFYLNWDAL